MKLKVDLTQPGMANASEFVIINLSWKMFGDYEKSDQSTS